MFKPQQLWQLIQGYHEPVFIVGGYIRERLLNRHASDLDVVVVGKPKLLARYLADFFKAPLITLDEQRAIYRVMLPFNFTVDIAQCHQAGIETDLSERDLSINAMAVPAAQLVSLIAGEWDAVDIIDPCGGQKDVQQGLIRALSRVNLQADPLRLLRVFRIAAGLKFQIEPQTLAWILELRACLPTVPAERIVNELELLLCSAHFSDYLPEMVQLKLLDPVIGWSADVPPARQQTVTLLQWLHASHLHDYQIIEMNLGPVLKEYMNQAIAGKHDLSVTLLLAALCLARDAEATQIEIWCQKLRLSNRDKAFIQMIGHGQKLVTGWSATQYLTRTEQFQLYQFYREYFPATVFYSWGLFVSEGGITTLPLRQLIGTMLSGYFAKDGLAHLPILINGNDIMSHLQIKPGPWVGKLMQDVQVAQAEGLVHTREQALVWLKQLNLGE